MTVGKPNFDLNSFGVKYLSKDQVQDFLEINKFGKNIGDTPDPVEETTDKDGNVIQKKPHPQKGEVFTDIKGLNPHQNPTAIDGGGYPGKWRRTGKKDKDGNPIKYQQTEEGTKPKVGQVPTSRKNDVQYGKLGEESTSEVRESFDMITNSPKYQEEIHRDAPLTEKEGTEKFDDTPANRALRDKIAMRNHKKKLAAEKKKKLKKANDIIMNMNIMKLDLMKDGIEGGGKNIPEMGRGERASYYGSQHKEGQAERERSEYDRGEDDVSAYTKGKRPVKGVNNKPDPRIDPEDYTHDEKTEVGSTGDASSYPADPMEKRFPANASGSTSKYMQHWDESMGKRRQEGTEHERKWIEPKTLDSKDRGTTLPKGLKEKAAETIYKAISLKLDLMKEYDRSKDVLRPEGVKEGKGKISYETPCVNCGRPYKKGETELNNIMEAGKRRRAAEDRKTQEEYYNN
jgi:hypothetical protein